MQFALLGKVQFELITYFNGLDGRFGADYAEHALIEGKPRIQWVGDKLDEWGLKMKFHQLYCEPEREIAHLRDAMLAHAPLPFVLATGEYKGEFVITDISVTPEQTDLAGTVVSADVSVSLKEHVPPPGMDRVRYEALAVKTPGKRLAPQVEKSVAGAENARAPLTDARQALGQAVGLAHGAADTVGKATKAIETVKTSLDDPAVLDTCQEIKEQVDKAKDQVETLSDLLKPVRELITETAAVLKAANSVVSEIKGMQALFIGVTRENLPERLIALDKSLGQIGADVDEIILKMKGPAAKAATRSECRPETGQEYIDP